MSIVNDISMDNYYDVIFYRFGCFAIAIKSYILFRDLAVSKNK